MIAVDPVRATATALWPCCSAGSMNPMIVT
jgi:hypothetical protein